ncbi:MAG: T9SS type A sorting domain-containing protein, partial [Bacteroidia bacterium]
DLFEADYKSNKGRKIGHIIPPLKILVDGDRTAFDSYNGRFFCVSYVHNMTLNPFPGDSNMLKFLFIAEADVKSGDVKYHKLRYKDISRFHDIHYDPLRNSLIFNYDNVLRSWNLNTGEIDSISKLAPGLNYANRKLSLYIPENQQYIYANRQTEPDTLHKYFVLDIKTGKITEHLKSKRLIKNLMYSKSHGLYGISEEYLELPQHLVSISQAGEVKILADYPANMGVSGWGRNSAVFNNNKLLVTLHSPSWFVAEFDLKLNEMNITKSSLSSYGQYQEFHTFNQPYIQTSENTYTSTYGKSYRWLWNNRPIENSNTQTYTPTQCGDYKVEVTHLDGRIDTSDAVHYEVKDAKGNLITNTFATAFPNPFRTNLNIKYKTCLDNEVTFKVFDLHGKLVYTHKTTKIPAGEHALEWNSQLQSLRYGLYIVQVFSGDDLISTQKIVKL